MTLQVRDLWFRYPSAASDDYALSHLNFQLNSGDCVALLGASGSGKSTLAQLLNGLYWPTQGSLILDHQTVQNKPAQLRALRRRIGMVFQFPEMQIFETNVFMEVAFAARQWGFPEDQLPQLVEATLRAVDLDPEAFLHRDPLKISGGESRLVTIASLLVVDPDWLILDEPTLGLDYPHVQKVKFLIRQRQQRGRGVILITHDLDLAENLCPRALVLKSGQLVFEGKTRELVTAPELETAYGLAASPRVQIWRGLRALLPDQALAHPSELESWVSKLPPEARIQVLSALTDPALGTINPRLTQLTK